MNIFHCPMGYTQSIECNSLPVELLFYSMEIMMSDRQWNSVRKEDRIAARIFRWAFMVMILLIVVTLLPGGR